MELKESDFKDCILAFLSGGCEPGALQEMLKGEQKHLNRLIAVEAQCDELYSQAYQAKGRLFQRLHSDKDADVTCIFENLMGIASQMAMAMFDSGVAYARSNPE